MTREVMPIGQVRRVYVDLVTWTPEGRHGEPTYRLGYNEFIIVVGHYTLRDAAGAVCCTAFLCRYGLRDARTTAVSERTTPLQLARVP